MRLRPNLTDVGWPPAPPARDEPRDVLDEAFALAAFNGRLDAMARLLALGAGVDGAVQLGLTALHLAVIRPSSLLRRVKGFARSRYPA